MTRVATKDYVYPDYVRFLDEQGNRVATANTLSVLLEAAKLKKEAND